MADNVSLVFSITYHNLNIIPGSLALIKMGIICSDPSRYCLQIILNHHIPLSPNILVFIFSAYELWEFCYVCHWSTILVIIARIW